MQDRRVGPTVSKEKWVNHAKAKMAKGYVLIVGNQRRTANFYMRTKGFEMCPFNIAKLLIKEGIVVESGQHHLGTVYQLASDILPDEPKRKPQRDPEETPDDVDDIIIDLSDDEDAEEATEEADDVDEE